MQNQPKQAETIPTDVIITIDLNGGMYARLHQLLMQIASEQSPEKFAEAMLYLKTGNPRNSGEYHIVTLLSLIYEVETKAREQGKTKYIDYPDPPS